MPVLDKVGKMPWHGTAVMRDQNPILVRGHRQNFQIQQFS